MGTLRLTLHRPKERERERERERATFIPTTQISTMEAPKQQVMSADGESVLNQLSGVHIEQVKRAAELCGFEMNNEYRVFALDPVSMTRYDNELLHASEVGSTFCRRQCCEPMRDNRTEIFMKSTNTTVGVYEKGCGISWCCCCNASAVFTSLLGGSENRYDAVSPNGCPGFTTLGFKLQNFWFRGPRSCCGHMPCFTYAFDI